MKSFVNDILDNQQINRRRHSGLSGEQSAGSRAGRTTVRRKKSGESVSREAAYRPAGIVSRAKQNSRFIDNIQQAPSRNSGRNFSLFSSEPRLRGGRPRVSARKKIEFPRDFSFLKGIFSGEEEDAPESFSREAYARNYRARRDQDGVRPNHKPRFSLFSVPAIPFAALVIFALGVFFVVYSQAGAFDWAGREVVSLEKDEGSQYNLALYAGVNARETTPVSAPETGSGGEEIPLDLTETFAWQNYEVKRGDSVSKIAAAHSVSMDAIIASNEISNARGLKAGEKLRIPNMDGIPYTVKSGDSLSGISAAMGAPVEAILDANDLQSDTINAGMNLFIPGARMNRNDLKMALGELFVYPLRGARLSSPFGWRNDPISGVRRHHAAIDLSAPQGTPIKAVMDGKVSSMGYNGTYGNFIILSHGDGFQTMYAHLYSFSVRNGDRVKQGTQIGTVGSTGYSTGPHLHFSVFKNNRAVNPLDYLNPRS